MTQTLLMDEVPSIASDYADICAGLGARLSDSYATMWHVAPSARYRICRASSVTPRPESPTALATPKGCRALLDQSSGTPWGRLSLLMTEQ